MSAIAATATNDPHAYNDRILTFSGIPYTDSWAAITDNDVDPDGGALTVTISGYPGHGQLTPTSTGFTYTPQPQYTGGDSFSYYVTDPEGHASSSAGVIIDILAYNPLPDTYTTKTAVSMVVPPSGVLANDQNPNNATLTAVLSSSPSHGTLVMDANGDGGFSYKSVKGFVGKDTFSYRLKNSSNVLSKYAGIVTIDVQAPPPVPPLPTDLQIKQVVGGVVGDHGSVSVQITSFNEFKAGAVLDVLINNVLSGTGVTDQDGWVVIPIILPAQPGTFVLTVTDGTLVNTSAIKVTPHPAVTGIQILNNPAGLIGKPSKVAVQISSSNGGLAGAPISVYVDGKGLPLVLTESDGSVIVPFTLPLVAGAHNLTVASGTVTVTRVIQVTLPLPVVSSITLVVPKGLPGHGVVLTSRITSSNPYKAGAPISAYVDGKKVASKLTDATGSAKIVVKLPILAGKHSIKVVSGSKNAVNNFTYGKAVTAKLTALKPVTVKKTETIKGSFGTKAGKVTLKITNPKGKSVTKIVVLSSTGKFSYKFNGTSIKGTYTVSYSYKANAKYYGAKSYKLTFKVK